MNNSDRLAPAIALSRRSPTRRVAGEADDRDLLRRWRRYAWLALAVSFAAYLLVSAAHHQAFHPWGRLGFFDLRVYRGAAGLVLGRGSVYDVSIWRWAPFTYPPFAAVVFTPLALLPLAVDEVLVTIFGVVAVFAVFALALRLPMADRKELAQTPRWQSILIPVAVAAGLWLEPVTATLAYGQIDLLIALLIVGDLSRRDAAKSKGALIGLAAGLKLTPLIFVPYLLFSRRRRPAIVALGTFASTVAVGYAALPGDTQRFWGDALFLDSRRVGGCCIPANQSLRGAILRLDPSLGSGRLLGVAVVVGIVGLLLAVLASRRGDELMGFSLCAITGLLVSPVSWTHHWTLAVPALLLLGLRVYRNCSKAGVIAVGATLLVGYSYLPRLMEKPVFSSGPALPAGWTLALTSYALIGLVALGLACVHEARLRIAGLPKPGSAARPSFVLPEISPGTRGARCTLLLRRRAPCADLPGTRALAHLRPSLPHDEEPALSGWPGPSRAGSETRS
jgi:alpha-1,2-mannosyltransferase